MESEYLIQKYCGNIHDRLVVCRSKTVALALKDRLCTELRLYCVSDMVNEVLAAQVDELIDKIFDENGKNKLLET